MDTQITIQPGYENHVPSFENIITILKLNSKVNKIHSKDGTIFMFEDLTKYELDNLNEAITNRLPFLIKS